MSSKRCVVNLGWRVLLWTFVGALTVGSCSKSNEAGGGSGGAGSGSGGSSASGGTTAGSGGASGSGGQAGSGGTTATGGSSSSGGAPGGNGGAAAGGSVSSGGSETASGGRGDSGGAAAGGKDGTGGGAAGGGSGKNDASPDGPGNGTGGASGKGGNTTGSGGGSGQGGVTGTGGGTGAVDCAGRVLSLGANGTGSDSDSAQAHVEIDMKTDLPIGNAMRTVEFWAFIRKTDWVGEKNQIYYFGDGSGANTSFGLDFGTNNVTGSTTNHATLNPFTGSDIRDDSGKDLGINSSTDQWVHIAMSWDGSAFVTYVNGLPQITVQASGATTSLDTKQSVLMIGCNPTNNNCFGGYFDELRVWNVARSATEIKDSYNKPLAGNEAGLVGYWKFDETSGSTTADAVTSDGHTAHNGTLQADSAAHNPTFVVPSVPVPLVCP